MIAESTILALQSIAAIFMAADYFFTKTQRAPVNNLIQRSITPINQQVDADVQRHLQTAAQNSAILIVATTFTLLGWLTVTFLLPSVSGTIGPWLAAFLALVALALFTAGMPTLLTAIVAHLIPIIMAASLGLVLKFLIRCPKGSVFGIGFLFLVASFACRWYNLR